MTGLDPAKVCVHVLVCDSNALTSTTTHTHINSSESCASCRARSNIQIAIGNVRSVGSRNVDTKRRRWQLPYRGSLSPTVHGTLGLSSSIYATDQRSVTQFPVEKVSSDCGAQRPQSTGERNGADYRVEGREAAYNRHLV